MNIQQIKAFAWLGALGVGGYLGYEVWHFVENKPLYEKYIDQEEIERVLDKEIEEPEPIRSQVVDPTEINSIFHRMDWTGKPEPVVVVNPGPDEGEKKGPPKTPVAQLLKVLVIQADPSDSTQSKAYVLYLDNQLKAIHNEPKERFLRVGQKLAGKYEHVSVKDIRADGVVFAFDDEEREDEVVGPLGYSTDGPGIVVVGPDGIIQPQREKLITTKGDYVPRRFKKTSEVRRNEFQVGTETARELEQNYSLILSRDLQYRVARDPGDGSVRGIQITRVAPDSLPAQHGIQSGEVLKSINGHRVTSVNDAVAYVKKESATTDEWVAVFEKQGREFTRTYRSPIE